MYHSQVSWTMRMMSGKSAHLGMNIGATLNALKEQAVKLTPLWQNSLASPQSAAITCVKPQVQSRQLVDSASGIHARHSPYYIRTVRGDNKDPITQFLVSVGIPWEPDVMKPDSTTVFSFPMKSPHGAVFRFDMSAIEQLDTMVEVPDVTGVNTSRLSYLCERRRMDGGRLMGVRSL